MKLLSVKSEPKIITRLRDLHNHLIDNLILRQQGIYTIYRCLRDEIKEGSREHFKRHIPSINPSSKVCKTYSNFIKGVPNIVRKHYIAKNHSLPSFDKHKSN